MERIAFYDGEELIINAAQLHEKIDAVVKEVGPRSVEDIAFTMKSIFEEVENALFDYADTNGIDISKWPDIWPLTW